LFFAAFFLLGLAGLAAIFATLVVPEWRVNHVFVRHPCIVRDKRVAEARSEDGTLYRPELQIEYEFGGQRHRIWTYDIRGAFSSGQREKQAILDQFVVGQQYDCWLNPHNPSEAVLVRGYSWWLWLSFIVPVSFILIGGGGLIYTALTWGKSAERRAAMAQRVPKLNLDGLGRVKGEFPSIPLDAHITNSPGTTLAFRLPADVSPAWALLATLVACLFWNGVVSGLAVSAVRSHLEGRPDWFLTCFVIPFLIVGIGLIVFFLRQLVVATGIGPTLVEISDHPIQPGKTYRLFLSQAGRLRLNSLELLLVCDEEATYRQGTDTRVESRRVYQQQIFRRERFEVRRGVPFEAECELVVPPGVMHSFKSEHNEISWKLMVRIDAAGWPVYERCFPVIVYPGRLGNGKNERRFRFPAPQKAVKEPDGVVKEPER